MSEGTVNHIGLADDFHEVCPPQTVVEQVLFNFLMPKVLCLRNWCHCVMLLGGATTFTRKSSTGTWKSAVSNKILMLSYKGQEANHMTLQE